MDGAQAAARNGAIAEAVGLSAEEVGALFDDGSGGSGGPSDGNTAHRSLQLQELAEVLQRVQDGATGAPCLRQAAQVQCIQLKQTWSRVASCITCQNRLDCWSLGVVECHRFCCLKS